MSETRLFAGEIMNNDKRELDVPEKSVSSSPEQAFRSRRRRLISSGLGASAIIATVASRPAWAGGVCTKSGLQSANLSGQHTFEGCGKSAGFWKVKQYAWPTGVRPADRFTSLFGELRHKGSILFYGKTLGQVISFTGASPKNPSNIGLHLIGAYVNAFAFPKDSPSGKGFVYYPEEIISLFAAAVSNDAFNELKSALEAANNRYDPITEWDH